MKKTINFAFIYAMVAICGGVFFREFTKFTGFVGKTTLSVVHVHFFALGMLVMLLAALFCGQLPLAGNKKYGRFLLWYNIGLPLAGAMLFVRGLLQVLVPQLSRGLSASISGISGIAHVILTVGLVYFFLALREAAID